MLQRIKLRRHCHGLGVVRGFQRHAESVRFRKAEASYVVLACRVAILLDLRFIRHLSFERANHIELMPSVGAAARSLAAGPGARSQILINEIIHDHF
jgi:hypothetical protein